MAVGVHQIASGIKFWKVFSKQDDYFCAFPPANEQAKKVYIQMNTDYFYLLSVIVVLWLKGMV